MALVVALLTDDVFKSLLCIMGLTGVITLLRDLNAMLDILAGISETLAGKSNGLRTKKSSAVLKI